MRLLFILLFCMPVTAWANDLPDLVARATPSVVGVGSYTPLGRPPAKLLGSGFIVGDGQHVLTSLHVVQDRVGKDPGSRLVVFIGDGADDADAWEARIVARDAAHDLALLRHNGPAGAPLKLASGPMIGPGREVLTIGFPIGNTYGFYPAAHRGIIATHTHVALPQVSARDLSPEMIRQINAKLIVYQLDITALPGNSGGAVLDVRSRQVIGLITSTFVKKSKENVLESPTSITFAMPISHAQALLRQAGQ